MGTSPLPMFDGIGGAGIACGIAYGSGRVGGGSVPPTPLEASLRAIGVATSVGVGCCFRRSGDDSPPVRSSIVGLASVRRRGLSLTDRRAFATSAMD